MSRDNTIDPDEHDDYMFDWAEELGVGETLVDHLMIVTGVTVENETRDSTSVTVRLKDPTADPVVLCRVTTSTGRVLDETWNLHIREH